MHNKVVYHAMKAFSAFGLPVLRFNFRGVGLSEGAHDHGRGEQDDVRAALDWLEQNLRMPILFAGFSFGSYVGLRACCGDPRVKGLIGLGLPVRAEGRDYTYELPPNCTAAQALHLRRPRPVRPPRGPGAGPRPPPPNPSRWSGSRAPTTSSRASPSLPPPSSTHAAGIRTWLKTEFSLNELSYKLS